MTARREWVLLTYRLPREPSTPRIAVWRKLRRLGAIQVVDGLVALPASARTREQFEWLAEEVVEAGGEAWTWLGRSGSVEQEQALLDRLIESATDGYRALIEEIDQLDDDSTSRRSVDRLRRELHRIEARDHVGPPERERAREAVERLAAAAAREADGVEA